MAYRCRSIYPLYKLVRVWCVEKEASRVERDAWVGTSVFLICALVLTLTPATVQGQVKTSAQVLQVSDFGAKGDGIRDDGPAFVKAMRTLTELEGPAVLRLGKGKTYRIDTLPATAGGEQNSRRGHVFPFAQADGKSIEGNDSHLVLRFPLRLLSIRTSTDITVQGVSFTYDPLPFTQGFIQTVDQNAHTIDVKVEPGFPLPQFDAPDVQDHSNASQFCWTFSPACHVWTKMTIEKRIDAKTYQFRVKNREGFPPIEPGFTIEGWNHVTGKHCGAARVVKVQRGTGKGYWNGILVLDDELQNIVANGESTSFWCHEWINAGSVIRNNRFDGTVRFRSPGTYENNRITEFMIVKPDVYECPLTRDMVFRGNYLPATHIPMIPAADLSS